LALSNSSSDPSPDETPDEGADVEQVDDTTDTTTPSDEVPDEGADEDVTPSIQSSPAFRVAAISTQEEAMNVTDLQDNDNTLIRKHGNQLFAIADYSTEAVDPDDLFGARGADGYIAPVALPAGWKVMGYITTDGISEANDVGTSAVNAVQDLDPVRNDVDSLTKTLQLSFLESNAWTKALAHDLPVSEWPASKKGAYTYHDGDKSDFPFYRGLIITQDGVGRDAWYRVEEAYRMQVSDKGDRTLQRSDPEETNRTFTCFKDPALDEPKSYTEDARPAFIAPAG